MGNGTNPNRLLVNVGGHAAVVKGPSPLGLHGPQPENSSYLLTANGRDSAWPDPCARAAAAPTVIGGGRHPNPLVWVPCPRWAGLRLPLSHALHVGWRVRPDGEILTTLINEGIHFEVTRADRVGASLH
jgi:hypothetical protein